MFALGLVWKGGGACLSNGTCPDWGGLSPGVPGP